LRNFEKLEFSVFAFLQKSEISEKSKNSVFSIFAKIRNFGKIEKTEIYDFHKKSNFRKIAFLQFLLKSEKSIFSEFMIFYDLQNLAKVSFSFL
jgi:hypothetical protein